MAVSSNVPNGVKHEEGVGPSRYSAAGETFADTLVVIPGEGRVSSPASRH
jgi:hypothetical protein